MTDQALRQAKRAMRAAVRERRGQAHRVDPADAADAAARHFLKRFPVRPGQIVSGYWPVGDELDPGPLLRAIEQAGALVALPVVIGKGRALVFRRWSMTGAEAQPPFGAHGIPAPGPDCDSVVPSLVVVPLLAFDRKGWRLGAGLGYYDRTLAEMRHQAHPPLAVGFAYAAQDADTVPHGHGDEPLDWIVTEREVIATGRARAAAGAGQ